MAADADPGPLRAVHHDRRVPADPRPVAALHLLVTGEPGLRLGRDGVDVVGRGQAGDADATLAGALEQREHEVARPGAAPLVDRRRRGTPSHSCVSSGSMSGSWLGRPLRMGPASSRATTVIVPFVARAPRPAVWSDRAVPDHPPARAARRHIYPPPRRVGPSRRSCGGAASGRRGGDGCAGGVQCSGLAVTGCGRVRAAPCAARASMPSPLEATWRVLEWARPRSPRRISRQDDGGGPARAAARSGGAGVRLRRRRRRRAAGGGRGVHRQRAGRRGRRRTSSTRRSTGGAKATATSSTPWSTP